MLGRSNETMAQREDVEAALTRIDAHFTALIVVDMQNDFCHPDGFYDRIGRSSEPIRRAIPPIQDLLAAARRAGSVVVFTRLVYDPSQPDMPDRRRIAPGGWASRERRLVLGSWGAQIVDELAPLPGEYVMNKADYSAFYGTDLEALLRRRGIQSVVLAGTTTYACVLHTAFDAFARDFDVVVAAEGVSCWSHELQLSTFQIVELLLGRVAPVAAIVAALDRPGPDRARRMGHATA